MEWSQVCEEPLLQNLPYKIELDQYGNIKMSPASNKHGRLQLKIAKKILDLAKEGDAMVECSIETNSGVKVADVAWFSDSFFKENGEETPYRMAPELCVEVISPSNSIKEMQEKIALYLARGAKEVWLCTENGSIDFFSYKGQIELSKLFPDFSNHI